MPTKTKPKTQEQVDKDELYRYYKSLVPTVTKVIFNTQYKRIVEDEPTWTARQIHAALRFAVEHESMTISSLAIVPYVMPKCKEWYARRAKLKEMINEYTPSAITRTVCRKDKQEEVFT